MSKPILCLDFDGVIHSYASGWKGPATISDPPVSGAFEFIERALEHFSVCIFSSRTGQYEFDSGLQKKEGVGAMREWCTEWAIKALGEVRGRGVMAMVIFPTQKPSAMVTIDDRAITFDGTWPDIDMLKNFKPWNKK